MKLLKHQQEYIDNRNKDKDLLAWEGGVGKTIAAVAWLRSRDTTHALILCPSRIIVKWKEALGDIPATVMSREQFKKQGFENPTAVIVDEADEWASPLFIPKLRSQRTEALYTMLRKHDIPTLLLTATPIRSTPWNLHTLLCFTGQYIEKKKWQEYFFTLEHRPYLPRPAWFPKDNWRVLIRPILEKHAHIVLLRDCVDDLPPVTEVTTTIKSEKFVTQKEWEPMKAFVEEHKHEQKGKLSAIKDIAKEYRKVVIVAHYREQVESLKKELEKDRETFMLYGGVKNQENIIVQAQQSDECYFIVQASLAAGYDLDSFSCIIFASMSFKYVDYKQMTYRVRRIHNLHPVVYHYLIGGRCDKNIHDTVMLGKDFDPAYYLHHDATAS